MTTVQSVMTSEPELIAAAREGDREAFAVLVDTYYERMLRMALKYTGDRENAEDITHEACIALAKGIRLFRGEAAFTTWLYRLVINCARDFYRRTPATYPMAAEAGADGGADKLVLLRQVLERVDGMGDGFRESVALVFGEGLSHAAAAEVLGVKESTVSWRIHEVRRRLGALMEGSRRGTRKTVPGR